MGESADTVGGNFLHPDEVDRKTYRVVPGGVVVPPRRDNNGRSPAFDPKDLLKSVKVNIYDGDQVTTLNPGEADEFGNPKPKDTPCPPSSPLSPTPAPPTSSASPPPQTSPSPPSPASSASPEPPGSGTSTTTKTGGRAKRSQQQPPLEEILTSALQPLYQRLSSLESGLASPTRSTTASASPESTKPPSSASTSTAGSSSSPSRKVQLESPLGSVVFEALSVSTENEGLLVILVDPKKPHAAPKGGEVIVIVDDRATYHCQAHELSLRLTLGGQEVLLILLVLLEGPTA